MTHLSLFSGIGGIDLAAHWAGFRTIATCEIDDACNKVLARHFPDAHQFKDVKDVTAKILSGRGIGTPTLISAGFPCQPFSVAGSRQGTSDERHLWPEVARVLCEVKPRWFLGENVRGLLSISDGRVFGSILRDLADLGYRVGWGCYGADEACGATHRRDRVFVVGYLADAGCGSDQRRGIPRVIPCEEDETERPKEKRERSRNAFGNRLGSVADAESLGRQAGIGIAGRVIAGFPGPKDCCFDFPPGPNEYDQWREVLRARPDLAPALTEEEEAQLSVCPVVDGVSRRMALKMLGNAVVPQQVYPILQAIADHERGIA